MFFCLCSNLFSQELETIVINKFFSYKIVKISVSSNNFVNNHGTGVLFPGDYFYGYVVTALHILAGDEIELREQFYDALTDENSKNSPKILIQAYGDTTLQRVSGRLIKFDEDLDIAVIKVNISELLNTLSKDKLKTDNKVTPGEKIFAMGYSLDKPLAVSIGRATSVDVSEINFSTTKLSPDFSGGVLINSNNHLIGIITRIGAKAAAVRMSVIVDLIKKWEIPIEIELIKHKSKKFRLLLAANAITIGVTVFYLFKNDEIGENKFPGPVGRP